MGLRSRVKHLVSRVVCGRPEGTRASLRSFLRAKWEGPEPASPAPETSAVPEGWIVLGDVDELPSGTIAEFFVDDEAVAVANVDGQLYAVDNTCPHAGGPLGDGELDGHVVACPWHGWEFDVRTGTCRLDPTLGVGTRAVDRVGGKIVLRMP